MTPYTAGSDDRGRVKRWCCLLAFLGALVVVLLVSTPRVDRLISNPDIGVELTKGQQILFGRHPHIDVDTTVYGPGIFYLSALAQRVADRRLIGPLAVIILGYLTAYGLMAWIVLRRSLWSWTFVWYAALFLPRSPGSTNTTWSSLRHWCSSRWISDPDRAASNGLEPFSASAAPLLRCSESISVATG